MNVALSLMPHERRASPSGMSGNLGRHALVGVCCVLFLLFLTSGTQLRATLEFLGIAQHASPARPLAAGRPALDLSTINVDDKAQLVLQGQDAEARNALIPVSGLPLGHMKSFLLAPVAGGTYGTALRCLTQAVYYEAANEPLRGRRAVAQVVLNRMHHPDYPNTVCGVVYQGSERVTGCQFSFTCDGSLLRRPMAAPWAEAQEVARQALAGYVEPSVGTATYYHADYVLPKWAFQLDKIEQVGRHIFYRLPGRWGSSGAFYDRYGGFERIPELNFAALRARAQQQSDDFAPLVPGLTVPALVTDRHAEADVGGRLDVTKEWRLTIPDPVAASSRYRQAVGEDQATGKQAADVASGAGEKAAGAAPAPAHPSVGAAQLDNRPIG